MFLRYKEFKKDRELLNIIENKRQNEPGINNILFLDYDGVFLSTQNDPYELMRNIMTLVKEFHFHIVISSSWRVNSEVALKTIRHYGCTAEIDGITPIENTLRYKEIMHYLMEHPFNQYLIIDDIDMGPLRSHAIKTDFLNGFTEKKLAQARSMFKEILTK